ncbi:phage portal protein [Bradyrhizobium sp. 156]|uniref:phage portal protein n=1 Tax=Bradyrhizobium sp. 156 TaxID=2782630 RepID=UPI00211139FC|nr:phage portal protein [Bradyrhizobium sp. 156]
MKLLSRWFGQDEEAVSREEPAFKTAVERSYSPDEWYSEFGRAENSVTGIHVSQATALNASAVMAAVTMLAEDVAKLPWSLWKSEEGQAKTEAKGHFLYDLLQEPNEWQNGLEFREILQVGLILRGNAYAPIFRTPRGEPYRLFPINPDWVSLWLANDGKLFWRITTADLFTQSVMSDHPFYAATGMIPYEDMLHIRGFSVSGLVGASRISLARETIALGLAQEQQAARWMANAAKPSGMLTTEQKLGTDTAKRLALDFKEASAGLQNSGKVIVGEQGLKFVAFGMTSSDLEFITSRKFQIEEIARIFRIPMHMMGELTRSTNNNIAQQAQEYINYTLTGYTNRWRAKFSQCFGLRGDNLSIEFDYSALTQADITSRINNWRTMVMSALGTSDEARVDLGYAPKGGEAAELRYPQNMAAAGSQSTGNGDGGGRPPSDEPQT